MFFEFRFRTGYSFPWLMFSLWKQMLPMFCKRPTFFRHSVFACHVGEREIHAVNLAAMNVRYMGRKNKKRNLSLGLKIVQWNRNLRRRFSPAPRLVFRWHGTKEGLIAGIMVSFRNETFRWHYESLRWWWIITSNRFYGDIVETRWFWN